jgi:hypothetical protein
MRRFLTAVTVAMVVGVATAPGASAAFGLNSPSVTFTASGPTPAMQAGSHPFEMTTTFRLNSIEEGGGKFIEGALRDLDVEQPSGFVGDRTAVPPCSTLDFLSRDSELLTECSDSTAVGMVTVTLCGSGTCSEGAEEATAVYNLEPPPGVAAKIGFWAGEVPVTVELGVSPDPPYNIVGRLRNTSQTLEVLRSELVLWGNPAHSSHDLMRGRCLRTGGSCPAKIPVRPFLTMPRSCTGPLLTRFDANAWWPAGATSRVSVTTPPGAIGCSKLGFVPEIAAQPTTDNAESPTGFNFNVDIEDEGLTSETGIAKSDIKKAVVTLPPGMTANPSLAEGLVACSQADLARETASSEPGEGCPQASTIGTVEVETPILEGEILKGQVFVATPDDPTTSAPGAENPFDSLIALYMVVKDPVLGVVLRLPGKVEPTPGTGQLVATFDDLPQYPVSHFRFRFREGGRSPLISPPTCGTHTTVAEFTPWADPSKTVEKSSSFEIVRGVGGGSCPPAGSLPFLPGFTAGSLNNDAGSYSPFYMRLTRRDGDRDLTRFSASLPPGVVAKLAGTSQCSDAAIAAARAKTGRSELAAPSCPASAEIGNVVGGAGVGSQLTYVPGKLYMAGPVGGAPLSVVAIVPAVAGPFDVGTVVVRQALRVDPRTAQVRVDSAASDRIPRMLAGIPLKVRDIRVNVNRPDFTLNPTSCNPFEVGAEIWGSGGSSDDAAGDVSISLADRFQAANCSRLRFKPRLSLRLKGGTARGDHPSLRGVYRPRKGDANLSRLVLRLPRSAFLDQGNIRTICTRVQFAAERCPKAAAYGRATAFTPLLDKPLSGPVYLRSSSNDLPDLVADLHGLVDIEAVARIDSHKGGIRATFTKVPDAPVTKVVVDMQGGRGKGLVVNSRDLCASTSKANLELGAHNGRFRTMQPTVAPSGCGESPGRRR